MLKRKEQKKLLRRLAILRVGQLGLRMRELFDPPPLREMAGEVIGEGCYLLGPHQTLAELDGSHRRPRWRRW